MRPKRSLSLVSRFFREVTAEFLYEAIRIKNIRQLHSLVMSYNTHRSIFEQYTVYVKFSATPLGMFGPQYFDGSLSSQVALLFVCNLIEMCKNLQTFELSWFYNRSDPVLASDMHRLVGALPRTLLYLAWDIGLGCEHLADGLFHILLQKQSLRMLQVRHHTQMLKETRDYLSTHQPLQAEQLVHLDIDDTKDNFFSVFRQQ